MLATFAFLLALQGTAPKTDTALLSEVSAIQPGQPFRVALKIKMAPEWHTYYLNPGDAGQATQIKWKLPAGFTAGPIQWPVPQRMDFQGIASYVYEDEVLLIQQITPPKSLKPGTAVKLGAHCTWLLCSTGCVPQSSDLSISLQVGAKAVKSQSGAAQIEAAWQALPAVVSSIQPAASITGKAVTVLFTGLPEATKVQFIPADVDSFGANEPTFSGKSGELLMSLPLTAYAKSAPKVLKGILVRPSGPVWIETPVR